MAVLTIFLRGQPKYRKRNVSHHIDEAKVSSTGRKCKVDTCARRRKALAHGTFYLILSSLVGFEESER